MFVNSRITTIFVIVFALIFSACSNLSESHEITKSVESRGNITNQTPTPFLGQIAKVRGENRDIKIAENLSASVEQQELPEIWLEFEKENGEISKIELNDDLKKKIYSAGKALFYYQYVINNSENPDERFNASYNDSMTFINTLHEIEKMEINSPDGERKLTEEEAEEILSKQAGLINDRYFELDDHFKPKSAFYKFKKSVNEKIGYSIF
jgi:hypothetical protein